ncbi:MAG: HpcH/HpaI aldolase/citrate lyase family protein [Hyphomicrobiaceae bacterium]
MNDRHPRQFYKPLVTGAPKPFTDETKPQVVERMIHFAGFHDPKMAGKGEDMLRAGTVDVLLGNFEDAVPVDQKPAAREAFIAMMRGLEPGDKKAGLWIRSNQLSSTMFMEDMKLVKASGGMLDVVMVPKVESAADIVRVDWLLAQIEAEMGFATPIMIHAILETAEGVERVLEIASASPRMHGMSLGPADLAADRGMKTTRVGGPHPDYGTYADAEAPGRPRAFHQGELWHFTMARLVDACKTAGIKPFYGPYGDFKDLVGCEAQFRNAAIMGCDGAWTLHPTQVEIARRVFSPEPKDLMSARRIVASMPDGTGAVMLDGKMQDDATWKQAMVFLRQAVDIIGREGEAARERYFGTPIPKSDPRLEPKSADGRKALALALSGKEN